MDKFLETTLSFLQHTNESSEADYVVCAPPLWGRLSVSAIRLGCRSHSAPDPLLVMNQTASQGPRGKAEPVGHLVSQASLFFYEGARAEGGGKKSLVT